MLQQKTPLSDDGQPMADPIRPRRNRVREGIVTIFRNALVILGLFLIPTGFIVALLTPVLPVGLPIIIFGVVLIARNASWGARLFQSILRRYPKLEKYAPDWLLHLIFGDKQV